MNCNNTRVDIDSRSVKEKIHTSITTAHLIKHVCTKRFYFFLLKLNANLKPTTRVADAIGKNNCIRSLDSLLSYNIVMITKNKRTTNPAGITQTYETHVDLYCSSYALVNGLD